MKNMQNNQRMLQKHDSREIVHIIGGTAPPTINRSAQIDYTKN